MPSSSTAMRRPYAVSGAVTSSDASSTPNARGASASPTRRMGGRGTPMPMATSGHTGMNSNTCASLLVCLLFCLCLPSYRTLSPTRQALTPTRIFASSVCVLDPLMRDLSLSPVTFAPGAPRHGPAAATAKVTESPSHVHACPLHVAALLCIALLACGSQPTTTEQHIELF